MKQKIGLWIDHKEAIIVIITDNGENIIKIRSEVEKHLRLSDDSSLHSSHEHLNTPSDDKQLTVFNEHIKNYYAKVIGSIRTAEDILIYGPGESKYELKKQIEKDNTLKVNIEIRSADKMTEHQILRQVQRYFQVSPS